MTEGYFSEVTIDAIQSLMNEKRAQIDKLKEEWNVLDSARKIYLANDRKHHEFANEKEMREAVLHNFNPFDTFSLKTKKKKLT